MPPPLLPLVPLLTIVLLLCDLLLRKKKKKKKKIVYVGLWVHVSINTGTWEVVNMHSKYKMLQSGVLTMYCNLEVPQQTAALPCVP